jgi:Tol biopolymer transport system component
MESRTAACLVVAALVAITPGRVATHDDTTLSAWSAPVNLGPIVNSATGDFFPFVSRDGRSLYFTSLSCGSQEPPPPVCRPGFGGYDIYVVARVRPDMPWGPAANLGPAVNTPANETGPALSPDGHWLFFGSDREGGFGGNDLYVSRRRDRRDDFSWSTPRNLGDAVNTAANEASPELASDEAGDVTMLYFDSNRTGGPGPFVDDSARNGSDIYASERRSDSTFTPAVLVEELSSPSLDRQPCLRRDGLELIFSSNRPGGVGVLDLWVSTRQSSSEPWSVPVPLAGDVNSVTGSEAGPALSFDGLTLYFQTVRPDGFGVFDLHAAGRFKVRHEP